MRAGSSERVGRRLAAVLAADVVGYSRLMEVDEAGTARLLREHRAAADPLVTEHGGRIVKTTGDGVLIEFPSVVGAVECAVALQKLMADRNSGVSSERRMEWRVGIHLGDILIEGNDIIGNGVNLAARLEGIADPGGICISEDAFRQVQGKIATEFLDGGEQVLKNITRPVRVFHAQQASAKVSSSLGGTALPLPDQPSIAVLPFQNMSGDAEQEYFADGMVDEIITALSRNRWLFVIARNSSFTYKGKSVDVRQIGRELGVRYVLEGSVRTGNGRVRITAQLIDALRGGHLWADRYDRELSDIFAVQDDITAQVAAEIEPQLYAAEYIRSERKRPENLDAWECVVRAISSIAQNTRATVSEAEALCRRALEISPGYGQAHSLLAWALMRRPYLSGDLNATLREAATEARAALMIDERDPWAHLAQGIVLFRMKRFREAEQAYRRALEFNPNSALAYAVLGQVLAAQGAAEAAIENAERALRLSPGDPLVGGHAAHTIVFSRFAAERYQESVVAARAMLDRYPEYLPARYVLIAALALEDDTNGAAIELNMLLSMKSDFSMAWLRENMPWTGKVGDRLLEGWSRAGVPER